MTYSYTRTSTNTFSKDDALRLGTRVVTDLYQLKKFYGEPNDKELDDYLTELCVFLAYEALKFVQYGFQRNGNWVSGASLHYDVVSALGTGSAGVPGGVGPGANITGAFFGSYLVYSEKYRTLSPEAKEAMKLQLPFQRTPGFEPGTGGLRWVADRQYDQNGVGLSRKRLE